jgi:ABC-2 type transport system permease protein
MTATRAIPAGELAPARSAPSPRRGIWSVYRAERRKLYAQLAIRLLALTCLLGPFVFAAILKVQSGSPTDTLYGIWVHSSGFALSLVLLAFAGSWGLPLIAGIIAGDMFSAEDRYGTWKLVLTRSCTRRDLFVGKLLAAATFSSALLVLTAISSLLAGLLFVGDQSLVSLNGTLFSPGRSLALVLASWLLCVFPMLGFASIGVMLSIATRNGIMGVVGTGLGALAMQLLLLVGTGIWMHMLLVGSAFNTWHALFNQHPYYGPLLIGIAISLGWTTVLVTASWLLLRGRDFAGTPVARRQGWVMPARIALAVAAVIALASVAGNWGPAPINAGRLKASLIPAFNNHT